MWKIGIIDDDFNLLKGMKQIIPWESLGAVWSGDSMDGRKGLELIRIQQPDIVLTDIYMPVMNGLEMIEQARADGYKGQIIIISGYSDFDYARKALRLEVNDYLSKPVTVEEISQVLERAIGKLEEVELQKIEIEELQSKLSQYEPFIVAEWVQKIILGNYESTDLNEDVIPMSKQHWRNRHHMVMAIEIVCTERLMGFNSADRHLLRFALSNIVQEFLGEKWPNSECVQLHCTNMAALIHPRHEESADAVYSQVRQLAKRIIETTKSYLQLDIRVGIGSLKKMLEGIHESAEEAFLMLANPGLRDAHSSAHVLDRELGERQTASDVNGQLAIQFLQFYKKLAESMRFFHREKAELCVKELISQLETTADDIPSTYIRILANEIRTIIMFSLSEANVSLSGNALAAVTSEVPVKLDNAASLEKWVFSIIQEMDNQIQLALNENGRHKQAVDFMIQYIHDNYAADITIDELASKVFLSRYYLNQIFKRATGHTFTNYLIHVRMEKARSLLLDGKNLIYEVAEMVGYKNIPYFSSLFKKTFGVNPSDYLRK